MLKNIVGYLDTAEKLFGNKTAYVDENKSITFSELKNNALRIASGIIDLASIGTPVLVYMDKAVEVIEAFLGVAYTGAFYVPIDISMPYQRVKLIVDTLSAEIVITRKVDDIPEEIKEHCKLFYVEDLYQSGIDMASINNRQKRCIDTDPIYAIFTSGSTGIPKGVLVSHRSVINFTEWWCETFDFSDKEVFANQTPFYFDASVKDIYATLRCGATMLIVPHKLFSLPKKLVTFLNDHQVNCIDWVPSVLCMIVNFRTFKSVKPLYLKKVMFLGEVMPAKQFNMWRKELPDIEYANIYGPTESTGDCTYYKINREIRDDESIPIGQACENTEVMILDDNNELITEPEITGEICVRGCSLALGYFNNPQKTDEVFVQNPLQKNYKERIYRTGDLGRFNSYGEILFAGRKDYQIKHMGHRIELGEIETAISALNEVSRVCCLFEKKSQRIIAVYEGSIDKKELAQLLRDKLPNYMIPSVYHQIEKMPLNLNGKIDRVLLNNQYIKEN